MSQKTSPSQPSFLPTSTNDKQAAKKKQSEDREQIKDKSKTGPLANLLMFGARFLILIGIAMFDMIYISDIANVAHKFDSSNPAPWIALCCWILSGCIWCLSKTNSRFNTKVCKFGIFITMGLANAIPITIIVAHTATEQSNCDHHCSMALYWSIISVSFLEFVYFIVDVIIFCKYDPTRDDVFRIILLMNGADPDWIKDQLSTSSHSYQQQNMPHQVEDGVNV